MRTSRCIFLEVLLFAEYNCESGLGFSEPEKDCQEKARAMSEGNAVAGSLSFSDEQYHDAHMCLAD